MKGTAYVVLAYLALLSLLFMGIVIWMLMMKWKNDWQERRWEGRKESFRNLVEQFLIATASSPDTLWLKSSLKGAFREWALTELMKYEERLKGQSAVRLTELLEHCGFMVELDDWLNHRRWWKRLKAIQVIAVFKLEQKRDHVLKLLHDPHPMIRMKAFWALGMIGIQADLPALIQALERDHYEWFQVDRVVSILDQLDMTEHEELGNWLLELFQHTPSLFARRCLLEVLATKACYETISVLMKLASDKELAVEVRIGCVKTMIRLHGYQALPVFQNLLADDQEHPGIVIMAMKGIAILADHSYKSVMVEHLGHTLWWVRYYSAVGLARMKDEAELSRLAQGHNDPYGRQMAHYFLQLLQQEGALWHSIESSLVTG